MHRRIGVAVVCAVAGALVLPAAASALTKTVSVGPPTVTKTIARRLGLPKSFKNKYNPDFNDFFLHRVTINTGDAVSFVFNGFHTVDLPGSSGRDLPFIVPGATVTGVNDFAGNPFWFNGHVPSLGFNPRLFGPSGGNTYDGTSRIDTGLPLGAGPPKPFKVTFTKAGTYKYFCDIHPGMVGYVVVRPKGKPIPSRAQDEISVTVQATADVVSAKNLAKTKPPAGQVSLGVSDRNGVELYQMFPATLRVKVGSVVTFAMSKFSRDTHTASFGPTPYLMNISNGLGTNPTLTQIALYPSDPVQPIPVSATSHGNGFENTGALDRDPTTPPPPSGRIKFTQTGTFHFICIIHPFMQGTVIVTK